MVYFVYILRTSKNTLYVGQTNYLEKRMLEHKEKSGKSAKYLRMFSDFTLVYSEKYHSRSEALMREAELKKLPKGEKEVLIRSCAQCGICCRLFFINLTQKEWESGKYETQVKASEVDDRFHVVQGYGGNILRQKKDGSCIYLKNNACSIHTRRPQSCRDFFCISTAKKFREMVSMIKERRDKCYNKGHVSR
jgi:putative endonuclease